MRTAPGALVAYLNSGQPFVMADLWTITLVSGAVYRWCSGDVALVVSGNTFLAPPDAPIIERGSTRVVRGLEVDTLDITLQGGGGSLGFTLSGQSLSRLVQNGVFDDATVQLDRLFMPSYGDTSLGFVNLFVGQVAGAQPSSTAAKLTVKSDLQKLAVQLPRNVFTPACSHILFDAGCGLSRAASTNTVTVIGTPTVSSVQTNLSGFAANDYRLGVMVGVTGVNAGVRRGILSSSGGTNDTFVPVTPWPAAPAVGDTFTVTYGCDKTLATCGGPKFLNAARFRGFPFVPKPEAAR